MISARRRYFLLPTTAATLLVSSCSWTAARLRSELWQQNPSILSPGGNPIGFRNGIAAERKSGHLAGVSDAYKAPVSVSSPSDKRVALPPAAVVSIETVRSVAKRCR